jgi:hypothetical protein
MSARVFGPLVLLAGVALTATGCVQFGEYAMGEECGNFSAEVSDLVDDAYASDSQIDNLWAGEATVWCRFDIVTGMDLPADAPERTAVRQQVETLLEDTFSSDVSVTLVYQSDDDLVVIDR